MFTQADKFWRDERASTAIEYTLIAMSLALVIISVVSGIGVKLSGYFTQVSGALK